MLEAKKKRKENIAGYILYLFQVEDLIRAFKFDENLIEKQLVSRYNVDEKISIEILEWYKNLALMMEKEGVREKGHLQFLINQIADINEFHLKLLETGVEKTYVLAFQGIAGLITELKQKNKSATNDIHLCLDAVYGYLLLKMQKKDVSDETTDAVKRLSLWLGTLSKLFKDFEAGELEI
ncbi:MAG: DUF4924 family protein [Prolixibacteraceae bacterium]|jgi:hypothetical protein|nr:DUF4924 family protein [Prolixibacteraceae bacterium]MBT6005234.1 DUF4924 family protein [Prolixibacteraceae bacterium]MBT6999315.1 DUF4924 family protein [Prolixibacteraceae bacterium]MBT7393211.1 DUF4924 family protein [Prolixibacteraceae bacterium]